MPTFNTSPSFIKSLPNFSSQGQQAVLNAGKSISSGSATAAPSQPFSGSSTKLSVAGQTGFQQPSPNLPNFSLNAQGTIPPPAPTTQVAPGVFQRQGETVAKEFTNYSAPSSPPLTNGDGSDTEFGMLVKMGADKGLANPIQNQLYQRYLAEWRASHPQPVPVPPPTPAMPPTLPAQVMTPPKPVGSTAAAPSVTGTGAVGQKAFGAQTQAGLAGKDLQTIKGTSAAPIPQPVPTPPVTATPTFPDLFKNLGNLINLPGINIFELFKSLQSRDAQAPPTSKITPKIVPEPTPTPTPPWQTPVVPVPTPTLTPEVKGVQDSMIQELEQKARESTGKGPIVSTNINQLNTPGAITTPSLDGGKLTQTPVTDPSQKFPSMTQILPQEQHGSAIQLYLSGQAPRDEVVSAIASPEAKATVQKMIATAAKAGDMMAVQKLAELPMAIDQTLQFINMIGRAVMATAKGFGTPNAPGVTEARMPMVEMGTGQALTTPQLPAPSPQLAGDGAQYLRPRFEDVETQRNKPVVYPYT